MKNTLGKLSIAGLMGFTLAAGSACATRTSGPDMLSYIPDDSPYVIAMERPFPDDFVAKIEPATEEILDTYQSIFRQVIEMAKEESSEDSDARKVEEYEGLIDELFNLMTIDGLRDAGIESGSLVAIYGHGLLPVMRIELTDETLFNNTVARIEEEAGSALSLGEAGGATYKYFAADGVRLIIATIDGQAVMTAVPDAFDDSTTAEVLGVTKPASSLADTKKLAAIQEKYGFEDYMTGYIDIVGITDTVLGNRSAIDAHLFEMIDAKKAEMAEDGAESDELSAVCKAEVLELAGIAPRIVLGYSDVSADALDSSMVIELREDIAAGLATLPAPVPGLGSDPGGLFSFGMSLDPMALRNFYEARLTALEEDPFECEHMAEMQEQVAAGRAVLSQPIPPVVYNFRGFMANIVDVDAENLSDDISPEAVDATMLVAVEDAESLLMMGAMFDPQLAELNLSPDGNPVKLELPQITTVVQEAYAAMTADALSISVGDGAEENAAAALKAGTNSPAPFVAMTMDAQRYYKMIGQAMLEGEASDSDKEMPLEMRQSVADMMTTFGKLYGRLALDVNFTEHGVEIDSRVTLGE